MGANDWGQPGGVGGEGCGGGSRGNEEGIGTIAEFEETAVAIESPGLAAADAEGSAVNCVLARGHAEGAWERGA